MKFSIRVAGRTVCETNDRKRARVFYEKYANTTKDALHHNAGAVVEFVEDGKVVEASSEYVPNLKDGKHTFKKKKGVPTPCDTDGDGDDGDPEVGEASLTKSSAIKSSKLKDDDAKFKKNKGTPAPDDTDGDGPDESCKGMSKDAKKWAAIAKNKAKNEARNGTRAWGMALHDNPNAEPPCRPGHAGMWMLSIMEGKRRDGSAFISEKNAAMSRRLVEALAGIEEKKETSASLRKKDKARRKRMRRGRGINSTAAIRKASKQNLRRSKAKRKSAKARMKALRSRKRNARLRGKD